MKHIWSPFGQRDERGATTAEYALLLGCIVLLILGGVGAFGTAVHTLFQQSCASAATAFGGSC